MTRHLWVLCVEENLWHEQRLFEEETALAMAMVKVKAKALKLASQWH